MTNSTLRSVRTYFALIKDRLGSTRAFPLVMLLLAFMATAKANPVDEARARQAATTFLNNNWARTYGLTDVSSAAGFDNLYVFTTESSFVIMAADDRVQPVLGYSLTGQFVTENMPDNVRNWLQGYNDKVQAAIDQNLRALPLTTQQWNALTEGDPNFGRATTVVEPLVQTYWNQGNPYNLLCPNSSVTGCVATAMAQVMKYWDYPSTGMGWHSYIHPNYGELRADFYSTTYDWTNMISSYSGSSTQAQREAVATLMYHCGVAVDMDYSPSGSGAYTSDVAVALRSYFNYSSDLQCLSRSSYDDATWIAMLKADLDLNRPIQYSGSGSGGGHSFVCDGYDNNDYFHFNWGWGSYCDGYYSIDNMNPGPGGIGSGANGIYNDGQQAIFGIRPSECTANAPTNLTYTQNGRNITLSWNAASGASSYKVYCENNLVGTATSTNFTTAAPFGTSIYYVRSVDSNGRMSLSSNVVTVTVDYQSPVVDDLAANVTGNNVNLSWTAPEWCYPETPTATMSYGDGSLYYSWTYTYYGHKYPASDIAQYANKSVYKVGTYIQYPGTYTAYVYTASNSSSPATKQMDFDVTGWQDIVFDQPLVLTGTEDLWVVMKQENTGADYPAPSFNLSSYNANACYGGFSSPTNLSPLSSSYSISWFIRTYVTDGVYTYNIYRDGSNIASNVNTTTYSDNNLAAGSYNYYVKTNYYAGESAASNQVTAVIGDGTYYAIEATANPSNGGTVTGAGTFAEGSTCTLTATANTGYTFVNWTKNGTQVSTNATYSFTVTEAANFVANFSLDSYEINAYAEPADGGSVIGYGTYNYGETCTLTATANEGYSFNNWTLYGTEVSTDATYSFTVTNAADYVANFSQAIVGGDYIEIGVGGTTTNSYLPSYSLYNYSLTQQIYTADEIGMACTINSIAFYNGGSAKTRNYTFYLAHTDKAAFDSNTDWIVATADNQVFSGSVTMVEGDWTTITLDTPFAYDGTSNLVLIADDNTGTWQSGMACRVFDANGNQAIRVYSDGTNYDPYAPSSYNGTLLAVKNQLQLGVTIPTTSGELTVHDGTTTNGYVPVYGFYADAYLKSEAVYPAEELAEMANGDINSIKYYSSNANVSWSGTNFQVFLTEVDGTSISSYYGPGTIVYEGNLSIDENGEMIVNFATPYHYNGGNLLIGVYNTAQGSYVTSNWFGETVSDASIQGYSYNGLDAISATQRNFLPKTTFAYEISGVGPTINLAVTPDPIDLGPRPNGAWMRPYTFTLSNLGPDADITDIQVTDGYFTLQTGDLAMPFTMTTGQSVELGMEWAEGNGTIEANLVVTHTEGEATFDVTALAYDPVAGDVWENPIDVTSFPFTATVNAATAPYYNNYVMPIPEIEDGNDVVYRMIFDNDTYLSASVTSGDNGKVALYREGFQGLGGPDESNFYANPMSVAMEASFEAMIGDENSSTSSGYFPFYTFYDYSIAENLFHADELAGAGVTRAPMTSLSWYAINETGYLQQGISIWMANVSDYELNTTSHTVNDMTLVYTGAMTPTIGWNEFVFNEGTFSWDGTSNVLIFCQRNNGSWNSSVNWMTHNAGFNAMSYRYQDGQAYDVTVPNSMNITYNRANIILKAGNGRNGSDRANRDVVEIGDGTGTTNVFPVQATYNYCFNEMLYYAEEIGTAGTINSIGFHFNGANALNRDVVVYMKNVERSSFAGTTDWEPVSSSDIVYTGPLASAAVDNWVTLSLDTPFQYDGTSNLMIAFDDNTGSWSSRYWYYTATPNTCITYYNDGTNPDPYNPPTANGVREQRPNLQLDITPSGTIGPEISGMTVVPGTYYLVASSTSDEFTVEIHTDDVPCPEAPILVAPEHQYIGTNPYNTQLKWKLDDRATGYCLRFGTDPDNLETVVDWTEDLAQNYTVRNLNYHTAYYWQVCQRNDDCTEGIEGPVWMFVTELNGPTDLWADRYEIMEGETLQLYWTAPAETTRELLYYEVHGYRYDEEANWEELVNATTTDTYYEVTGLTHQPNTTTYFFVNAVYDIDLPYYYAASSYSIFIYVNAFGAVEGHVYEQDGSTGIANANVTVFGYDYYGFYQQYDYTTNEEGYFIGEIPMGNGYNAYANATGYQEAWCDQNIEIMPDTVSPQYVDIIMDEEFKSPLLVEAEYYPNPADFESTAVQVTWDDPNWHTYCQSEFATAWRQNVVTTTWAYHYPADVLAPYAGYSLDKVSLFSDQMYNAVGGNYTCNVYIGGDTPYEGMLVSTFTVDVPFGLDSWVKYALTTPVAVTGTESLWVVWTANDNLSYPAGCSYDYNENGDWWLDENGWGHLSGYCWTMRNHFTDGNGRSVVLGAPNYQKPKRFSTASSTDNAHKVMAHNGESSSCVNPNPKRIPLSQPDRSLQYYRVYRTDYFNNGPFTEENTVLVADNVTGHSIIDETFGDLAMGTYKYGVSAVYEGNRESRITWLSTKYENLEECQKINSKLERNRDDFFDFDDATLQGWTTIDADGDGLGWVLGSQVGGVYFVEGATLQGAGHNSSNDMVCSGSYSNITNQVITPDNYLVSPQVNLGGTISFWACAQDANYAADHFGVAVSTTSNTDPYAFTMLSEWTMTAKGTGGKANPGTTRSGNRAQGNWYEYTVDLSAFAGQTGYVAIRHFNCSDQFVLDIDDITITEGGTPIQLARESAITWSNPMDKDMYLYNAVDITVTLNSGDSPEGVWVSLDQPSEQYNLNPFNNSLYFYMDETGYHAWDVFRKGTYYVSIWKEGYNSIWQEVTIDGETHLVFELEEIMESVSDLYVSRTGWASWNGLGNDAPELNYGSNFFTDFEQGLPEGWTTIDADGDGYNWILGSQSPGVYHNVGISTDGMGHDASNGFVCSGSWSNAAGMVLYPDNYLVSPQVDLGGTFSFWACSQDIAYVAEHFGVAVSTTDTNPYNFTLLSEWTMSAKGQGGKANPGSTRSGNRTSGNWYQYTVDLSAYAGQTGYIAIRHFNCYDQFILNVDDVELTNGRGNRHFEEIAWTLSDDDENVLATGTTVNDYLQVPTDGLVEGQVYRFTVAHNYSSGLNQSQACRWVYQPCDNFEGASDLDAIVGENGVTLSWTYPEAGSKTGFENGKGNRDAWDLITTLYAAEAGHYGVVSDGQYIYTSNWGYSSAANNFYKYDLEGNVIEGFTIPGCSYLRGMTYDGQYIYGVANSSTVYCVDLANHSVVSTFESVYGAMRGITYDPQRDGFWVIGNWTGNLTLIDRNGNIQYTGPAPESASDLAYYMDENNVEHIFCFNNGTNDVNDWVIGDDSMSGSVFNFNSLSGVTGTSGGCFVGEYDGKMAFFGDIQQDPNLIGIYELHELDHEPSPVGNPFAAAIFRNSEWIGLTTEQNFVDADGNDNSQYEVRIVYNGMKQCPYNNAYFTMSCPQSVIAKSIQTNNLSEGWNWWSTYIEQDGIDGLGMLQTSLGDNGLLIKSQTAFTSYAGGMWVGLLNELGNEQSYHVQTNASCTVSLEGPKVDPANHPINLSTGWNWIGYPVRTSMSIEDAMANHAPTVGDMVKSQQDGFSTYYGDNYGWIGSLHTLRPGMGLMYKSENDASFTYASASRGETEANLTADGNHWQPNLSAYPDNMNLMAVVELEDAELNSERYEIAAFADGECRGSVKLMYVEPLHRHMAFLTVAGEEAAHLQFGLYDTETGAEYLYADELISYQTNATLGNLDEPVVLHFRGNTGIDEMGNLIEVYPNPVESGARFNVNLPVESKLPVRVEIVNALGSALSVETFTQLPASMVAPRTAGVYTLRIHVEGKGMYCRKLVVR